MTKFILFYKGPATHPQDMPEEKRKAVMAKWGEWMSKVGKALVDMGQPMTNGVSVADDGSKASAAELNGYSIIEAKDMEAAKALVADHPFLSDHSGKFSVELYELMPSPKM